MKRAHLVQWFTAWWLTNHLEKYEFVNGKDDIPYMKWKITNVWNHQAVYLLNLDKNVDFPEQTVSLPEGTPSQRVEYDFFLSNQNFPITGMVGSHFDISCSIWPTWNKVIWRGLPEYEQSAQSFAMRSRWGSLQLAQTCGFVWS